MDEPKAKATDKERKNAIATTTNAKITKSSNAVTTLTVLSITSSFRYSP